MKKKKGKKAKEVSLTVRQQAILELTAVEKSEKLVHYFCRDVLVLLAHWLSCPTSPDFI